LADYVVIAEQLKEVGLSPASIREIIQASTTKKITRTFLTDQQLNKCAPIFDGIKLNYYLSPHKYLFSNDSGKGGFSNAVDALLPDSVPVGSFMVHLGLHAGRVIETRGADLSGDHRKVGDLLGIPTCCVDAFLVSASMAECDQNDHTLYAQCSKDESIDPWAIHCAQYFGYGLVSYFPCSPSCKKTAIIAKANAKLLKIHTPALAENFITYQSYTYLYSEYDGVFAFRKPLIHEGDVYHYDNRNIEMSSSGLLAEYLMRGNQLRITSPNNFSVLSNGEELIRVLSDKVRFYYPHLPLNILE
jgi:hypothetical protein